MAKLAEYKDRAEAHAALERLLPENPAAECREDPAAEHPFQVWSAPGGGDIAMPPTARPAPVATGLVRQVAVPAENASLVEHLSIHRRASYVAAFSTGFGSLQRTWWVFEGAGGLTPPGGEPVRVDTLEALAAVEGSEADTTGGSAPTPGRADPPVVG